MTGTYKEFYKFVHDFNPYICSLWEDFHKRPDPKEGDKFLIKNLTPGLGEDFFREGTFKKVEFDSNFIKGVAFNYIFDVNGDEYKVYSINDVYDGYELDINEQPYLYGFWSICTPIDKK